MVGWMDDEALHRTLTSGRVTFWSRSRQEYWRKGDTSGHVQYVQGRAAWTATATPCWSRSTRSAPPATPGARTCFEAGGPLAAVVGDPPHARTRAPAVTGAPPRPAATSPRRRSPGARPGRRSTTFRGAGARPPGHPGGAPPARRRRHARRAVPHARRRAARARSCWSRPRSTARWARYSFVGVALARDADGARTAGRSGSATCRSASRPTATPSTCSARRSRRCARPRSPGCRR